MPQIPMFKTLREKILKATEEELIAMAKDAALSWADSSRMEGLILNQEELEKRILQDYRRTRAEKLC